MDRDNSFTDRDHSHAAMGGSTRIVQSRRRLVTGIRLRFVLVVGAVALLLMGCSGVGGGSAGVFEQPAPSRAASTPAHQQPLPETVVEPDPDEPEPIFGFPLRGVWVRSQTFGGGFTSSTGESRLGHLGEDYAAPFGTAVVAVGDGTVVSRYEAATVSGWGNAVILQHRLDGGESLFSLYGHLNRVVINVGDDVMVGQQIGTVGNAGFSTGPHLHFAFMNVAALGGAYTGAAFDGDTHVRKGVAYYRPSALMKTPQPAYAESLHALRGRWEHAVGQALVPLEQLGELLPDEASHDTHDAHE